ncbi:protein SOB FIVE-LIKE 6-like [Gastrolobium bilobum]|uniref:protein SOB FIVE-LIKE 6-like n=1 Tax=Gastrolobium bilobum TaxID=150636 RepID=UPI002AB1C071|nr:protein SOB FIVE-LIKE 6-like [Gastrolobium bilobum]
MDMSSSQYNNASESGWTHYLNQSSLSERKGSRMEEEEDLSMVSDASSGPPHYHEEDDQPYCVNWYPSTSQYTKESEKKKKVREYGRNQQPSSLDDTASSPVLNDPKKKVSFSGNGAVENAQDFSPCLSATRIKRKPKFQKHLGFFQHSLGGKQSSEEPGGFVEEERK